MLRMDRIRDFSKVGDAIPVPDLVEIQVKSYERFLQADVEPTRRKKEGLEALMQEIFPIVSYDERTRLEYLYYELDAPRYDLQECRDLRLTYGLPFRVRCRLTRKESKDVVEESIYLGEIPRMIGGGEFIINGAERVIVSQLHRSPGVDFSVKMQESDRPLHGARLIPERGSWIEIAVTKKDSLTMWIDQSSKIPATTFLRAMSEKFGADTALIAEFYPTKSVNVSALEAQTYVAEAVVDPDSGEELVPAGGQIGETLTRIQSSTIKKVLIVDGAIDPLVLNTLAEDPTHSHDEALINIYKRLRPGNPPQLEKAKTLFNEKFYDENRYRLGKVGRFRLNRKFNLDIPEKEMIIHVEDMIQTLKYIIRLRDSQGVVDDIDHLGNRRLRTIDELASEELRKGFLKLRRTVQERMSLKDAEELTKISELVNSKSISSAMDFFFGRGELSQVVDQQNPLSQLTHERRLSALGPGGLNRKRAGFETRDVHISHYGRICPIETPEGQNIGLITSLSIYAGVDEYGFITTPYRKVSKGAVLEDVVALRADEELEAVLAPPDSLEPTTRGQAHKLPKEHVLARASGDVRLVDGKDVQYLDISPKQTVGISAALIPFLEHDDANRALMGSNMQRQAVPLLRSEIPIVATGMEKHVAVNSSMVIKAKKAGTVTHVDGTRVVIDNTDEYKLRKFNKLNERACLNQKPIVKEGQRVKKGEVIADGSATWHGELALGRNVLVGFMPFDGYNFEDAILISERLVKGDYFTSVHLEEYDVEVRETKLGREEFTRDIPNVSERALRNLDAEGVVRIGTRVGPGDIMVGKVSPKSKSELSPEEKLLHAIFGRAGEDVKNDSLELPAGEEGVVVDARRFSRRVSMSDQQKKDLAKRMKDFRSEMNVRLIELFRKMVEEMNDVLGAPMIDPTTRQKVAQSDSEAVLVEQIENFNPKWAKTANATARQQVDTIYERFWPRIQEVQAETERKTAHMKRGDELPSGVLEMVKVRVATKRKLGVGDKMAGRHGNKGVIARILPEADMPFMADGTPIDICLNPLGVPGRMNLGQILETHLGWAAAILGFQAVTPVFDGAKEQEIFEVVEEANAFVRGRAYADQVRILKQTIEKGEGLPDKLDSKDMPGDADWVLDHVSRFCGDRAYRQSTEGKDNDAKVCAALRAKFYSPKYLAKYSFLPTGNSLAKRSDLKAVESALIAKYSPSFNKDKAEHQALDAEQRTFFNRCVALIDDAKKADWVETPKPCTEKSQGLYFFANSDGEVQYIGIAGGAKGLSQRIRDHFSQNSYGDNLVKRFAERLKAGSDAKAAKAKLQNIDEDLFASSLEVIQKAGETREILQQMPFGGKMTLFDGRTGEALEQKVTVGYIYMNKLHHLVDEKIHARATGPYSLITQQPLGGKARTGGQRFGEMEVWGLEAYGASYTLQELLTVKSDDVEGRTKIYESMVKGTNTLEAGTPVSFDVLCNELRGLGLNIQLEKKALV